MGENEQLKVGGMILAAGGSSRLGRPKQLVEFEGKTLLRRAVEAMAATDCSPIVAVLGAESERSADQLAGLRVHPVINPQWQTGMSSSIVHGITALLDAEPQLDAVMITLCDQPFVTADVITKFLVKQRSRLSSDDDDVSIIAARYNSVLGVPALFTSRIFDELTRLTGDKGARRLIRDAAADSIDIIDVPEAAHDIDSPEDLRRLATYRNSR